MRRLLYQCRPEKVVAWERASGWGRGTVQVGGPAQR